jgi:hypothetical protein
LVHFRKWDEKETFEPHTIHGEDNVFDVITNAVYIAALNGKPEQELYPYIKHFLKIYSTQFFESSLKEFLLKRNCMPLLNGIQQALQEALENKRYYQVSQLFSIIVHYDKNNFNKYRDTH